MKTTTNHGLKKPDGTDIVNIEDLNYNADTIDGLLVPATTTANGLMSKDDKTKLNGIATGANNYTHPATHPASMISGLHAVATSGSYNDLLNKPSTFTPSSHTHTKSQITDFPTSLPANGGNADTVDGLHATDFATASHTHDDRYYNKIGIVNSINLDTYITEGITIIGTDAKGTLPPNQNASTIRHGVLRVTKTSLGIIQEIFTSNDIAYSDYASRYYYRNLANSSTTPWKEISYSTTTSLSLLNGWVNYGMGFQTITATKVGSIVTVNGLIKGGTTTEGTSILQLPTGFRPSGTDIFNFYCATGGFVRFNLSSDGYLKVGASGLSNTFLQVNLSFITSG